MVPRCPKLQERRALLIEYTEGVLSESQVCLNIFKSILQSSQEQQVQFFLDCSVIPEIIHAAQTDHSILTLLFRSTRTWCYSLHRTRLKILGRWWNITVTLIAFFKIMQICAIIQFEHYNRWFLIINLIWFGTNKKKNKNVHSISHWYKQKETQKFVFNKPH